MGGRRLAQALGTPIRRKEDAALLSGRGRYADDLAVPLGTLHAHVIRSPHASADIVRIDATTALAQEGVWAVVTGEDVRRLSDPFLIALKAPIDQWSLAVERVRYVGEPVALVVAESRYLAEDAAELVVIDYAPREAVVDPRAAVAKGAPILHEKAKSNEISVRTFTYGDPQGAFDQAHARVALTSEYPRQSFMPMECYVVVAQYHAHDDSYDVMANFQGPFSTHPVMARALRVPGTRLRLRIPPDSGGSFGIKLSVFPYIVLASIAARITGRPVKWVEDRAEHLVAASSGPNRITEIEAAVAKDGRILALKLDQLEDYGAYLRAPMPGPLYRMHGACTGAYDVPNVEVTNRVVLTNKMPASLIRGFGGPQLYLALERLVQRIAIELGLDHLAVMKRNLVAAEKFPYRTAAGALYDSGNYLKAVETAVGEGRLADLTRRREAARAAGRHYGIGFAAVVEPGMSNMGYLSTLLTADAREKAGPKNGAASMVTVNIDPLGAVSVTADVTVQGQGHETVLSQIVADQLGISPDDVDVVLEMDTAKDQWSIAAGTYSCRFTPGTAVAAHMAAGRMRDKLKEIAARQLNVLPDDIELVGGKARSRQNPDNAMPFGRVAGTAHWSPVMLPEGMAPALRETAVWSPPELEPPASDDRINTSLTYGFVFDMCGVEIDPLTYQVRVDRYVSIHDAGRLLNPMIAEGQLRGSFV
jgi:2-furoyl-CoA dehydrogenase large subunit